MHRTWLVIFILVFPTGVASEFCSNDEFDNILHIRFLPDAKLWYVTDPIPYPYQYETIAPYYFIEKYNISLEMWNPNNYPLYSHTRNSTGLTLGVNSNSTSKSLGQINFGVDYYRTNASYIIPPGISTHNLRYDRFTGETMNLGIYSVVINSHSDGNDAITVDERLNASFSFDGSQVTAIEIFDSPLQWDKPLNNDRNNILPISVRVSDVEILRYNVTSISEIGFSYRVEYWNPSNVSKFHTYSTTTRPLGAILDFPINSPLYADPIINLGERQSVTTYEFLPGLSQEIFEGRQIIFNLQSNILSTTISPQYLFIHPEFNEYPEDGYNHDITRFYQTDIIINKNVLSYHTENIPANWPIWDGETSQFEELEQIGDISTKVPSEPHSSYPIPNVTSTFDMSSANIILNFKMSTFLIFIYFTIAAIRVRLNHKRIKPPDYQK